MSDRRPSTFLSRPFWRDYVLGGALAGIGFTLSSPGATVHPAISLSLLATGLVIVTCAIGWSLVTSIRPRHPSPTASGEAKP